MAKNIIQGGAWIRFDIDNEAIGLATGINYDENFNVQPVEVLNVLGRISLDVTGYTLTINVDKFIKRPGSEDDINKVINGERLVPLIDQIKATGSIPDRKLTLIDTNINQPTDEFEKCVLTSHGKQVTSNAFLTENLSFEGLKRVA